MAFNKSPQKLVKGWSIDGTNYVVPAACLKQLSKLDGDPDKGDSRAIIYAFVEAFYQWYKDMSDEDRPNKLQVYRSSHVNDVTDTITKTYTITVNTSPSSFEVSTETA